MKIGVFYYNGFAEFEIIMALLLLNKHEIISIAVESGVVMSEEKQKYVVDLSIDDCKSEDFDLLLIPGGNSEFLLKNQKLESLLRSCIEKGILIGGICGGSELLAGMGFLKGKRCTGNTSGVKETDSVYAWYDGALLSEDHVVRDGNIITAQGQAYAEFAVAIAEAVGVIETELDAKDTLKWLKNNRD